MKAPIRRRYDRAIKRLETTARDLPRAGKGELTEEQSWLLHEAALEYTQSLLELLEDTQRQKRAAELRLPHLAVVK